jgi:hypothetical protein
MLFSKSIWKVSPALLATAALILITGVAGAVFNADRAIDPNSPNFNGSGGWVDGSGENYSTGVYFMCTDSDNDFEMGCDSNHPDRASMSTNSGKVDQRKNDNPGDAWMVVNEMGGIDEGGATIPLDCDRVQLKGKSNDRNDKIDSQCTLKSCDIPGALTVDQVRSAIACMDDSVDNGSLGKNVESLKLKNDTIEGKITSKGLRD